MLEEQTNTIWSGRLGYNHEQQCLELSELPLRSGDRIELCVFGHWIPGTVERDNSGWYLLTLDYIGIRLRPGLLARHEQSLFSFHT